SVTLAIGGTIITDILALLVLAAVTGMTRGDIGSAFWIRLAVSTIVFGLIVFFVFPLIASWFFKRFSDNISQYIFVLAMVFLGSFLAEVAGLEAIIGAFLSGLALNRFIPHTSALMNRIEFVGNAVFIPFFLIGVGMLIDFSVLFKGFGALQVAAVLTVVAIASKFVAAWLTQGSFRLSAAERQMIFGLSTARVGATLAIVLVGYNIILGETATGEPIRLLNEDVLNGTILMILVTCTVSSITVEKASRKLALAEEAGKPEEEDQVPDRILVSLAYPENAEDLVDLALMLKPPKSAIPVYALRVISDNGDEGDTKEARKMLDNAVHRAASSDNTLTPLSRHDLNVSNGIIYTIKENVITEVIIGIHRNEGDQQSFLGDVVEDVVQRVFDTVYAYRAVQPFNTIQRLVVLMPPHGEYEKGFAHWFNRIYTISRETGFPLLVYADAKGIAQLQEQNAQTAAPLEISFNEFSNWEEFLIFTREVKENDLFIMIASRKGYLSTLDHFDRITDYLSRYFTRNSIMIIFPEQHVGG
ncbi:MAG: cation:proton antiporter, partial [Sphingobacteriales bacterium]